MCRRASGAAVATFATFDSAAGRWNGPMHRYDSSERGWRGFCPTCGSTVCFGFKPRPERVYVAVGILDEPDDWPAGFHDHRGAKIGWLELDPTLPDADDFRT